MDVTHLSLVFHKGEIDKQCRLRSDAAECGVWSGSALFALNTGISINMVIIKTYQIPLILEMDQSEEWKKNPFGINGLIFNIAVSVLGWISDYENIIG